MESDELAGGGWRLGPRGSFWCARFAFLRVLGLVYLVAFAGLWRDGPGLIGARGLLPASLWMDAVQRQLGGPWPAMARAPSLFWLTGISDALLAAVSVSGALLAAVVLLGYANAPIMAALWALYFSLVSVGQRWFHFGWESQLLETGLLACFLVPLLDGRPFRHRPSRVAVLLGWWLVARLMLGAGLIKLRGSPCWTELTCLEVHFQTQPIPGPLSRWFHLLPRPVLHAGVLVNHLAELVAPCLIWGPRRLRHLAGAVMVAFQATLILSGNLSFLNWLSIAPMLLLFDDQLLAPGRALRWESRAAPAPEAAPLLRGLWARRRGWPVAAYAALVLWLSVPVVVNLLSPEQSMNRSFGALRIVNTYGAFGSVGSRRFEIAVEGTADDPEDPSAVWQEYVFRCKPGPTDRRPCWITPWHDRLDWLAWFAGLEAARGRGFKREAWVHRLVDKLLEAEPAVIALLAPDGVPAGFAEIPPRAVRVRLFEYRFAAPGSGWWDRELLGLVSPAAGPARSRGDHRPGPGSRP
jgi:hypothetical protein